MANNNRSYSGEPNKGSTVIYRGVHIYSDSPKLPSWVVSAYQKGTIEGDIPAGTVRLFQRDEMVYVGFPEGAVCTLRDLLFRDLPAFPLPYFFERQGMIFIQMPDGKVFNIGEDHILYVIGQVARALGVDPNRAKNAVATRSRIPVAGAGKKYRPQPVRTQSDRPPEPAGSSEPPPAEGLAEFGENGNKPAEAVLVDEVDKGTGEVTQGVGIQETGDEPAEA